MRRLPLNMDKSQRIALAPKCSNCRKLNGLNRWRKSAYTKREENAETRRCQRRSAFHVANIGQRVEHHKLDQSWHGANMRERGKEREGESTTYEHAIYSNIVTVLLLKTNNICLQSYASRINNARTLRIRSRNHLIVSFFFFSTLHSEPNWPRRYGLLNV